MRRFDVAEIEFAADMLRAGGVLAYPTEAVFGLGCDPGNRAAFERLFEIKRRPPEQGVLLIAADFAQLADWIGDAPDEAIQHARATWPGPYTWVFPRSARVPAWITGSHPGIALRVTAHPPAAALCRAFSGAIVSTSANRHGQPPSRNVEEVIAMFDDELDAVLDGPVGDFEKPTPIANALTGAMIRP